MFQWLSGKLVLILGVACALLLTGLVGVSLYANGKAKEVGELEGTVSSLSTQLGEAQESLKQSGLSAEVSDTVVTENTVEKDVAETKTLINIAKIDSLASKRAYNEIDDTQLKSALSDSMWDAYCATADPNDTDCTARKLAPKVQGGQATKGSGDNTAKQGLGKPDGKP